ncbi:MAG TPA: FGGY family carbohydrate kinase, partial [Dermatophilaceae bacterium]
MDPEDVHCARAAADRGDSIFGNTDAWLLWNLTGGVNEGVHITDVTNASRTNASRTMLMNLGTLNCDDELLYFFDIPRSISPRSGRPPTPTSTGTPSGTVPSAGRSRCAETSV